MADNSDTHAKRFPAPAIAIAVLVVGFIIFVLFVPSGKGPVKPFVEGDQAPEFSLLDTEGRSWRLADLRGSVVLINFWATWCPPCRTEMPSLSRLFKDSMEREDLVVLTVLYQDDPEKAKAYFKDEGFSMPIILDPSGEMARDYGLTGVPETFVIDKEGKLKKHIVGPTEFDSRNARHYLESLSAG
jgi:peroxiredoxin